MFGREEGRGKGEGTLEAGSELSEGERSPPWALGERPPLVWPFRLFAYRWLWREAGGSLVGLLWLGALGFLDFMDVFMGSFSSGFRVFLTFVCVCVVVLFFGLCRFVLSTT